MLTLIMQAQQAILQMSLAQRYTCILQATMLLQGTTGPMEFQESFRTSTGFTPGWSTGSQIAGSLLNQNISPLRLIGKAGAFNVIDKFSIGDLRFEVLESHGGHIPGNVFFLNREYGLLFTADYMLNVNSLTAENKDTLNVYKYLLISPNSNGPVFREEMAALQDLMERINTKVQKEHGRSALILPGHGEYYPLEKTK